MINQKWMKIIGIATSFPSAIFISGWGTRQMVKMNILTQAQSVFLFLFIVLGMLFLMVYYAYGRKN